MSTDKPELLKKKSEFHFEIESCYTKKNQLIVGVFSFKWTNFSSIAEIILEFTNKHKSEASLLESL